MGGKPFVAVIGEAYGRLTVIGETRIPSPPSAAKQGYPTQPAVICQCECGGITTVRGRDLRNGKTVSCGCKPPKEKCAHGHDMTPANTYVNSQGNRGCRKCHQEAKKQWRLREKRKKNSSALVA